MKIKRMLSIAAAIMLTLSMAACANESSSAQSEEGSSAVKVEDKKDESSSTDESETDDESSEEEYTAPEVERNESVIKFSNGGGVYENEFDLTLEGEGTIYYTLDGSDPAVSKTRIEYSDKISVMSREGDANIVSAVDPTLISGNFNSIDFGEKGYVCSKKAPEDSAVDKCTVIRAAALGSDGKYSLTSTETYYIGKASDHIEGLEESVKAMGTPLAVVTMMTFLTARGGYTSRATCLMRLFRRRLHRTALTLTKSLQGGLRQTTTREAESGKGSAT